jgi:hypothetical protein
LPAPEEDVNSLKIDKKYKIMSILPDAFGPLV